MTIAQHHRVASYLQTHPALIPIGLACAVAMLWALIEALGYYIATSISPYQTVWARYATHLLFLMVMWGPRRRTSLIRTPRWRAQLLRGLLMLGMPAAFIMAAGRMPVGTVWSIFWIAPLAAMLAALLLWKEKIPSTAWIAALLGLAGSIVILHPPLPGGFIEVMLVVGMALCFILYMLATRWLASENTFTSLFYTAFAVFLPLSFVVPGLWQPVPLKSAAAMVLIGLFGFALLYALDRALESAPVSMVAPFLYGANIWHLLIDWALHNGSIQLADLAGVLIILVPAAFLIYVFSHRTKSVVPPLTGHLGA